MLRKFVMYAPWQQVDHIEDISQVLGYAVNDYGWVEDGKDLYRDEGHITSGQEVPEENRRAFISVIFDDDDETWQQVFAKHVTSTWYELTAGSCIVCMPDGLEHEWYEQVGPMCQRLHEVEAKAETSGRDEDQTLVQVLRDRLKPLLDTGHSEANVNLALWGAQMNVLLGLDL